MLHQEDNFYEEGIWGEVKEHFLHLTTAPLPHLQELAGSPIWVMIHTKIPNIKDIQDSTFFSL